MRAGAVRLISPGKAEGHEREDHVEPFKFNLDPKRPPALTNKAKARLARLRGKDIDLTDIPATHGVSWKRPGLLVAEENKPKITLRIDADVLSFFKRKGSAIGHA